jgi:hypothetical protein
MKNVSFKGLMIAIAVALAIDIIGGVIAVPLYSEGLTEEAIESLFHQTNVLVYMLIIGTSSSFLGGYICAKYAKLAPYKNATIFGFIGVIISLVMATFDPIWVDVVGCLLIIPAAIIGARLVASKNA